MRHSVLRWDAREGDARTERCVSVLKATFVDAPLRPAHRFDFEPVRATVAAAGWNRRLRMFGGRNGTGGAGEGDGAQLEEELGRRYCMRGPVELGRSGIHALRQEQRGRSVGEGRAGDGEG